VNRDLLLQRKRNREERARPKHESYPPDGLETQQARAALMREFKELDLKITRTRS
jgi:hypothetical protein